MGQLILAQRVADLTLALAQAVDRAEMKELRYASLLHDFGKVGVREQLLVKAKKLYPGQIELIEQRFAYARKALEHGQSERKLVYLLDKGWDEFLHRPGEFPDELLAFIVRCNEPTLLREGNFERLADLAARLI